MKMSDIAQIAGVSESTVSRALNNSPLISQKTRDRIRAIANKENYTINSQARNFRLQKTNIISAIIPFQHAPRQHISDPFFMDMLGAVADYLTEHDYDLLISRVSQENWQQKVREIRVDGALFIGQSVLHEQLNQLASDAPFPFIVWGANLPDQKYHCISSDNTKGAYDAVNHLIRIGKKNILFLGDTSVPEVQLRHQGYCKALTDAGKTIKDEHIISCSFAGDNAYNSIRQFVNKKSPFDAIFATSDVLAMNAIKALYDVDIKVPDDVSVIGYDDISIAAYCTPALTTVRQHISNGGRLIAENLVKMINGEEVESVMLPAELVVRST